VKCSQTGIKDKSLCLTEQSPGNICPCGRRMRESSTERTTRVVHLGSFLHKQVAFRYCFQLACLTLRKIIHGSCTLHHSHTKLAILCYSEIFKRWRHLVSALLPLKNSPYNCLLYEVMRLCISLMNEELDVQSLSLILTAYHKHISTHLSRLTPVSPPIAGCYSSPDLTFRS
jgi:hypothetical protein